MGIKMTQTNGIHSEIADHYEGINDALHERDELRNEVNKLRNDLAIANGRIDYLEKQLNGTTRERDHYMRYSFALTTRINAMQDIWAGMMELSKQEANSQLPAPMPKAVQLTSSAESNIQSSGESNNCEQEEGA